MSFKLRAAVAALMVIVVTGAVPDPAFAGAAGGQDSINDGFPTNECNGDITVYGGSYSTQEIGVWNSARCGSNPNTGANWNPGISEIVWGIDANDDNVEDFFVVYYNDAGLQAGVYRSSDLTLLCSATPGWDGDATFGAAFPPACIGTPPSFRMQVLMGWDEAPLAEDCTCPFDVAPNSGWTSTIVRSDPPPPPPPPRELTWYLRGTPTAGPPASSFAYGLVGYAPISGDWDGNGSDTPGVFVNGSWYLRNSNTAGPPDIVVNYGVAGYTPVVGDWNGDGTDTIGVFVNGSWFLRNANTPGSPDISVNYGVRGYVPVVGDWDADPQGVDSIGVFVNGSWFLRNSNTAGSPDIAVAYGAPGYTPIVGRSATGGPSGIGVIV